ncbi:MAG: dihydroorotate dehydrogenase electron transfer subunit [Oscillospiraceae bacterium]|nr:dihydroorotate dehydrogenase electron transfer subunit [Oscillospiraceae bacterium]
MPIQKTCTILRSERLIPYGYSLVLDAGEIADTAHPGQFLQVQCDGQFLRRPISICDAGAGRIRIVFEIKGKGTQILAKKRVGDSVDVIGPLGHGFPIHGETVLLVGGGIGAAPLFFAARRCLGTVHAILGFRSANTAVLTEVFRSVCRQVDFTTEDGSLGESGFVDGPLRRRLEETKYTRILACGPQPMLRAVAKIAAEFNVPCFVSMEERMACGVGACLGCACKMKDGSYQRVCHDGPVFSASEVSFDD